MRFPSGVISKRKGLKTSAITRFYDGSRNIHAVQESQSAHVRGDERDGSRSLPGEYLYPSLSTTLAANKSGIAFAAWPPE
jgi:hypothetical protein